MYKLAHRYVVVAIAALIVLPLSYFGIHFVRTPETYAGDAIETRECRQCGGTGKDEQLAEDYPEVGDRCPFCRGDGKVDVIIPGAHRPSRIRGAVLDEATTNSFDTYQSVRPGPTPFNPGSGSFDRPAGSVAGAKVVFRHESGELIEAESNPYGLFSLLLPPGDYQVTIIAPGFDKLEDELEVPVLTEPIWLEEAKLVCEPGSFAEAQSMNGIEILAALAKVESDAYGFMNVSAEGAGP